ncbi:MAG: response regulator transcription factor [Cytophagales bacterium]|jgi:two-component system copper resistance phosphate regulon response regulator CusR|nr:response regulator transcription factor [Cytophagales bacterium]
MTKLLVVEDEPKTLQSIRQGLEENHYEVDIAYDGQIGRDLALRNAYHLLIVDIIIPGINGIQLVQEIRRAGIHTPVLMLTALDSSKDRIASFDSGADQYLSKPFEFAELLSRVRNLTKRETPFPFQAQTLQFADITMNLDTKTVQRGDKLIELTVKEFTLLEFLIRNRGRVISKTEIAEKVWDIDFDTGTNVVEVYVSYLRRKIDKDFDQKLIHTHYGIGYILKEE